ncbi:MAG: endonuclease domain-containing protein [Anaerolineae bacterium]|nr:endonuclease domain-containing protein [Anaerolineae bacterium]
MVRQHRTEPTAAESKLWSYVRNRQLDNFRFRRQHPIERFIVDFYCREAKLIIEVDGEIHDYTANEDAIRQEFLELQGYQVSRFSNDEILTDLSAVIQRIRQALKRP